MEFKHACPECGVDLEPVLTENGNLETFWCPDCDTDWAVCPDCGNLADMDENWNFEQGVCDSCQSTGEEDIIIVTLDNPEQVWMTLEELFGNDEE